MRLKTLSAPDMNEAMRMAKEMLGDDAVILSSMRQPKGQGVQVTVAIEDDEPDDLPETALELVETGEDESTDEEASTPQEPSEKQVVHENPYVKNAARYSKDHERDDRDRPCEMIEDILAFHAMPQELMQSVIEKANDAPHAAHGNIADTQALLTGVLPDCLTFDPIDFSQPGCFMLVGPAGAGKTTAIGKLAAELVMNKRELVLISTDNKRAGGVEQLSAYASIMDTPVEYAETKAELKDMLINAPDKATILIDSFGGNPYDFQEMRELGELASMNIITPILVMPSGMDAGEAEELARTFSFLSIEHVIISKSDAAKRYGAILGAAFSAGLKLSHVTDSPHVSKPLRPLDALGISQLLMQHQRDKFAKS